MATKTLYQKLLEVQKAVTGIAKDARSKGKASYEYVSSSAVLRHIRTQMDEQGLILEVAVTEARVHQKIAHTDKTNLTELDMVFTWVNVENPEDRQSYDWYGQGADNGEQAVGKALTYAEKYFLLKFFHISTDEDDPDRGNGQGQAARPAAQPKGSAKPPAAADKAQPAAGNGKTFGDKDVEWFDRLLAEYPPEAQIAVRAQLPTFLKGFRVESLKALPYLKKQDLENWAKAKAKDATPRSVSEAEQAEKFFARREEAEGLGIPTEGLTTVEALAEEIAKVRKSQEAPA